METEEVINYCHVTFPILRKTTSIDLEFVNVHDKDDIMEQFVKYVGIFEEQKDCIVVMDGGNKDDELLQILLNLYKNYCRLNPERSKKLLSHMFFRSEIERKPLENIMNSHIKTITRIGFEDPFLINRHIDKRHSDKFAIWNITDILVRFYGFDIDEMYLIE